MVKSTVSTAKKHKDRELAAKTAFEKTQVDIQTAQTMMILLESKEDMVVLKALSTLDKYAAKLEQNAQTLYEEGILKLIIPLLSHEELLIKRFAIKLLSELAFLPQVSDTLLRECLTPLTTNLLKTNDDLIVTEFCTSILAELTKHNVGKVQVTSTKSINTFILLLSSTDPDIQKNSLQVIFNILSDHFDHTFLTKCEEFNVKVLIELLDSEYVSIQNLSLDILKILTGKRKENMVLKYFQEAGGVVELLRILKNFYWKDIHAKCLDILGNICDDANLAQHFLKDGVFQLFTYMDFANDPFLRKKAVEVITKIAKTSLGRKVIHESDKVEKIVAMLKEPSVGMAKAVSECVSDLSHDHEALQLMLEIDTLSSLIEIAHDQERDWDTRKAAIYALSNFLIRDLRACEFLLSSDKRDVFENVLSQFDDSVPVDAAIIAASCIQILGSHPALRPRVVTRNCISSLLQCFNEFLEDNISLKIIACETLCTLISEMETRQYLKLEQGLDKVWSSLTKHPENAQLLQAAATFVHICISSDKTLMPHLLKLNVLNWLLSQSSLRNECPAWELALEAVLTEFLPLKFAMTGRLEITDITESNFYITKLPVKFEQIKTNAFPILDNLINDCCCPIQTLYVANFDFSEETSSSSIRQKTSGINNHVSVNSLFFLTDVHFLNYLDSLKLILTQNRYTCQETAETEIVIEGDVIRGKARLIGQFVAKQMSGLDRAEVCSHHTVDLHVNELKVELMNSIIPIGHMRAGSYLERAFLFKVLSDRVGLPSSLVRGNDQRAWVEVAIPNLPPSPRPSYPNHLLKPNFLVDLMSDPGSLHSLGSYDARKYCGLI